MRLFGTPFTLTTLYALCLAIQIYRAVPLAFTRSRYGGPSQWSDIGHVLQAMFMLPGMFAVGGFFFLAPLPSLALWIALIVYTIRAAQKVPNARLIAAAIMVIMTLMAWAGTATVRSMGCSN